MNQTLAKALSPHRGLGQENTLEAIAAAIHTKPFMVEFDVQNINSELYLGHPPTVNFKEKLEDVLPLYKGTNTIPKIDLKCSIGWQKDIDLLLSKLLRVDYRVLVNIGGDILSATEFMKAEEKLMQAAGPHILLNIDIARYGSTPMRQITHHVNSLKRKPFSISTLLEGHYEDAVQLARQCGIYNVHFWSNHTKTHKQSELLEIYNKLSNSGMNVVFDIKPTIIDDIS